MQTISINVMNLCVPCHCHCRYCLLSWSGATLGVDYARSEAYARRFYDWLRTHRPDLAFSFYFGYSMEHPQLLDSIDFLRSIGSPGGEFLQFDGMQFRTPAQLEALLHDLKSHGIRLIDLTFYGTRDDHDRFVGRIGDFDYMLSVLSCANRMGLSVQVGIPLTQENISQANDLCAQFSAYSLRRLSLFVPHAEGRGATLEPVRLRLEDLSQLNDHARSHFNRSAYRTESEWYAAASTLPPWEHRTLTLALTPHTIDALEQQDFAATIADLEALDDTYHAALPSFDELMYLYGDPHSTRLFSRRDITQTLQRRCIRDRQLNLYDIHDERQSFIRRH